MSERSERALTKTRILAMNPTKWLQTATPTTELTLFHSIRLARRSSLGKIKGTDEFLECSIRIGNALMLRKMVHEGTGESQRASVPLVNSALSLAAASVSFTDEGGGKMPELMR